MTTEAQKLAKRKYDTNHTKLITMKLNLKTDHDILNKLEMVDNKQGYIKRLIREDIKND